MVYQNILDAIGHTPIVELNHMVPENCARVLVKYEGLNVGGSIKTRVAYNMIRDAEKRGKLNKNSIIVVCICIFTTCIKIIACDYIQPCCFKSTR